MIPYSTDAPIYHWPIATVGLIVVNVAATLAMLALGEGAFAPYVLVYGQGLHPLQWVTSNFLHAGIVHLLGNMIYLWGFGLIVEGKVGWWRFLVLYLGIGFLQCGFEQAVMQGSSTRAQIADAEADTATEDEPKLPPGLEDLGLDPDMIPEVPGAEQGPRYSLGASAIIYGLIAIGMVWAPRNEISILLIYGWGFMLRTALFDLPIVTFALIYFGFEILGAIASSFAWGSPILHLMGAVLGFLIGTVMVKADLVDCEGWDLYSIRRGSSAKGKQTRKRKKGKKKRAAEEELEPGATVAEVRSARALAQLRGALEAAAPYEALSAYQALAQQPEGWRPLEKDVLALISLLQREKMQADSVPIMEDYVARFPRGSTRVRLKLAQLLVRDQQRPGKALRLLAELPESDLPEDLRPIRRQVEARARSMTQDENGLYELEE